MTVQDFLELRRAEQVWAHANGFSNPDIETNGWRTLIEFLADDFDAFVDVGAGDGMLSAAVAQSAHHAKVFAFEPNATVVPRLRRNAPLADVRAWAVSEEDGEATLCIPEAAPRDAWLFIAAERHGERERVRTARVSRRKLDTLLSGVVPASARLFVSLDANGHEAAILSASGQSLLRQNTMIVALTSQAERSRVGNTTLASLEWLSRAGFDLFRLTPHGLESIQSLTIDINRLARCTYVAERGLGIRFRKRTLPLPLTSGETFLIPFADEPEAS
jgi:FkbM family methyltransferase